MKKLEETFNLPPMKDVIDNVDDDDTEDETDDTESGDQKYSLADIQEKMVEVDKINAALSPVTNLESLDEDMDRYARMSVDAYEDLLDIGKNVEDRHAAAIFDSAAKMMSNALTAKTTKADKKLKVIQMQLQKEKLDLEKLKLEHKMLSNKTPEEGEPLKGSGMVLDRNELIRQILDQSKGDA